METGTRTNLGSVALDVLTAGTGKPPLLVRMEKFTHIVASAVLCAATALAILGSLSYGYGVKEMFLFGVALAVSAIPEGLPIALTVALSVGATRMAQRGVIIRSLAAVEGLGSCTAIASDKTGTLTCNELTARAIYLPDGQSFQVEGDGFVPEGRVLSGNKQIASGDYAGLDALVRAAVLCNESDLHLKGSEWVWRGDPTDVALLSLGHKVGVKRVNAIETYPQINQIPFEPEYQYAASFHNMGEELKVFVKGAPERVLSMCNVAGNESVEKALAAEAETLASQGYRVLAFAEGVVEETLDPSRAPDEPTGLTFLGFVGMIDPLRSGVREAVEACAKSGIQVSMITGDHPVTALAIARELGMAEHSDQVMTGVELAKKSEAELSEIIKRIRVFARVAPHQKLDLVKALRASGHFVAVTGDGVNDAPALRASNIGVAMGKNGTDVAREAAEIVISDNNFASIIHGIEEGRVTYDNIRKVIYLLISTGAAEVVLITLAVLSNLPLPLLPVQLLWLNLVTNGIQDVALAFEPSEGDMLKKKTRPPKEPIFNRLMVERTVIGGLAMGVVGFFYFLYLTNSGWSDESARNALLLLMVLFENVHIANCRSENKSAFSISLLRSPILLCGAVIAFLIHVLSMHLELGQAILKTEPVSTAAWLGTIACALSILVVMEVHKFFWNRRFAASNLER